MPVAVSGAAGHTGRFVLAELRKRGWPVVAVGRDTEKLAKLRHVEPETDARVAAVNDPQALNHAFDRCSAVINCAHRGACRAVRRASVSGTDIYAVSAPHVVRDAPAGVLAAGEIVNARAFLEALSPVELRFVIEELE